MTYSATVLADSPLAYWRQGEASGTTITDTSGNAHTGTYSGGRTLGVAGLLSGDADTAVTYDGSSGAGSIAHGTWADVAAFTAECWFKTTQNSTTRVLFARSVSGVHTFQFTMASGKLTATTFNGGTSTNITTTGTYFDGLPHHAVLTFASGTAKFYVDNALIGTQTGLTVSTSAAADFQLANSGGSFFFAGTLDEVAFYSSALSATRVAAHYNSGAGAATTDTASATLNAVATLSSSRVATRKPSDSLNATATLSASRVRGQRRPATLNAAATLSTFASTAKLAAANLAATATLASARVRGKLAAATLTAVATLTPATVRTRQRTVQLDAAATLSSAVPGGKTASATLTAVATLLSAPARPLVAPVAGPFEWGFQMLAPAKALIPVEAGLDFIEWGFVMLQPGDALIGDPA